MLAARFTGLGWRESAAIGALMNTRGTDPAGGAQYRARHRRHFPALFAMMVLMALVTTFMTTPLLA
jgi:Kef-type K+ transport system membrane component KefB